MATAAKNSSADVLVVLLEVIDQECWLSLSTVRENPADDRLDDMVELCVPLTD